MQDWEDVLWEIEPHTEAKLAILRAYLKAWFPIVLRYNQKALYIDGFAGPGVYKGGEQGSPIVALITAMEILANSSRLADFKFIESNAKHREILSHSLSKISIPKNITFKVLEGEFEEEIRIILDDLNQQKGKYQPPIFSFIDPFGATGVRFSTVAELLSRDKSELFINFDNDGAIRLLATPVRKNLEHVINLVGTEEVLNIENPGKRSIPELRRMYHERLTHHAKYVRFFEMRDKNKNPVYDLFFASNHPLGFLKMKEAMWDVDPEGTFSFSDANDPNQMTLFIEDHKKKVAEILQREFSNKGQMIGKVVAEFIMYRTFYLGHHKTEALEWLEENKLIYVDPLKLDRSSKRRKGSYPDDSIITFH